MANSYKRNRSSEMCDTGDEREVHVFIVLSYYTKISSKFYDELVYIHRVVFLLSRD